jgi:hypothetical protein
MNSRAAMCVDAGTPLISPINMPRRPSGPEAARSINARAT